MQAVRLRLSLQLEREGVVILPSTVWRTCTGRDWERKPSVSSYLRYTGRGARDFSPRGRGGISRAAGFAERYIVMKIGKVKAHSAMLVGDEVAVWRDDLEVSDDQAKNERDEARRDTEDG